VRGLIGRALAKDPEARFADGCAFVEAIEAVQEGRPLPAAPATVAVARVAAPAPRPRSANTRPPGSRPTGSRPVSTQTVTRPPAPRRRGRVAMVVLPLLGLLTGAAIAAALFQSLAGEGPNSPAEAAEVQDQVQPITLDAARYIGRPVDEVVTQLEGLGLDVERRQVPTSDTVPGSVTDVTPDGRLMPGDAVVVSYAVAPGTGGTTTRDGDGAGVTGASGGDADPTATEPTTTEVAEATGGPTSTTGALPAETTTESAPVTTEPTETSTETTTEPTETSTETTTTAAEPTTEVAPPA
jgi:serine/threonine-protein kinase